MKLPTRLAVVLGALYGAVLAASTQLHLSTPVHTAIVFAGVLLAALGIHPTDSTIQAPAGEQIPLPSDGASQPAHPPVSPV